MVQAAIAACHALGPSYPDTDWNAIVSWYDDHYALWHATPGVLLRRLDRPDEAADAESRAATLPLNDPQRRLLRF